MEKISKIVTFDFYSGGKELFNFLKRGEKKYAVGKSHNGRYPLREGTNFSDWDVFKIATVRFEIFYPKSAIGTDLEKFFQISEEDFNNLLKLKKEYEEIKQKEKKQEIAWKLKSEELEHF
jgi:hypothetical protein